MFPSFRPRLVLLMALALLPCWASASLLVHPTRLVFEKNQRAAQVELINDGQEAVTYRISMINKRMTESGEFANAAQAEAGERFADQLLRYSPRQVTLMPGVSQVVRIMVRKPAELAAGEYRTHLQFDRIDRPGAPAGEAASASDIGVSIALKIGVSIPIIVRHGELGAPVLSLSHLALSPEDGRKLQFQIERSGDTSFYGDLAATFTPAGGAEQPVGRVSGLAVYTPNAVRRASLALTPAPGTALAHGALRLTLRARPEAGGAVLAQAELPLP